MPFLMRVVSQDLNLDVQLYRSRLETSQWSFADMANCFGGLTSLTTVYVLYTRIVRYHKHKNPLQDRREQSFKKQQSPEGQRR